MSFFYRIKQFFQKEQASSNVDLSLLELVPTPLIPWEIYSSVDPDMFTCLQGNESFWLDEIWYPYWESLTEKEKVSLRAQAPTESWREWLDWRSEGARKTRVYREKTGLSFDYHTYLEDFKISYVQDVMQSKK